MQTLHVNGYDMAYLDVGQGAGNQPAAGLRARLAVRFPDLVVGTRTADAQSSRDRAFVAAFLPRALGRRRRHLFDRPACRRRDRFHREARYRTGRPDGPFPRRTHLLSRRAAAAGFVAQADPGRARRRARRHARSRLQARPLAAGRADRGIRRGDHQGRYRRRPADLPGCAGRSRRLEAAAGDAEAAFARQCHDADRADARPAPAVLQG